jgi:regulator of RNase E activity RraA
MNEISSRLSTCYSGIVNDVLQAMGERNFVLPHDLTALEPGQRLCGPAFTLSGRVVETDAHTTLLAWTKLLSASKRDHVWVCQPNTQAIALMGELSAETLKLRGCRGCIIDGGTRDAAFILKIGLPIWRRFNTPADIVGHWLPDIIDGPIQIGGVTIEPGDLMLADLDGVIRVPRRLAREVADRAIEAMGTENRVRTAILAGTDPVEA